MKRSPMKRHRHKEKLRQTSLAKVNRARKAKAFKRNYDSTEYVAHIKSLACAVCGATGYSQAAHVVPRGMGGAKGRASDLVPLCGPRPLRGYLLDGRAAKSPLAMHPGCHFLLDGHKLDDRTYGLLKDCAARLWVEWTATKTENE